MVPRIVHDHAYCRERDARWPKLKRHLDQGAVLVQVFEWIESHILVFFRLIYIFLILRVIVVRITLIQPLISHVF